MARGGSSGESRPGSSWAAKARMCSKVTGSARRRRSRHTHSHRKISMSTDNQESSIPEVKAKDPLRVLTSSTGYTTEAVERDEDRFFKEWENPRVPGKNLNSGGQLQATPKGTTPFVFQKRLARIDWRTLHSIDVDRVYREVGKP